MGQSTKTVSGCQKKIIIRHVVLILVVRKIALHYKFLHYIFTDFKLSLVLQSSAEN